MVKVAPTALPLAPRSTNDGEDVPGHAPSRWRVAAPDTGRSLAARFLRSAERFPERTALTVAGVPLAYAELRDRAAQIAQALLDAGCARGDLVGIFAQRSSTAFSGILGALMAGCGYVPLNPTFPAARTLRMAADLSVLIVGAEALAGLDALLDAASAPLTIIGPEIIDFGALRHKLPRHRFVTAAQTSALEPLAEPRLPAPDDIAYLLFTSGSTGVPKGVPVTQRNVAAYLDHIAERFALQPDDRASQNFELTFDLSVHDLFATWQSGAALCVPSSRALLAPARFISEQRLTVWFSVPSAAMMMSRMRVLRPGAFPTLRLSLFCGEALPLNSARQWAAAAPHARLENLYGPTEATISITGFRWEGEASAARCRGGIVPIGTPFPGQRAELVDEQDRLVSGAGRGELLLAGSQVTAGYWRSPEKTAERYVRRPEWPELLWYRTGDIVERDDEGCLYFIGRADDQIKLNGHRIELQEIDAALRRVTGSDSAVAVPVSPRETGLLGIVACIEGGIALDDAVILRGCAELLPSYMVPSRIHRVSEMPLNVNGKIDRGALKRELEQVADGAAVEHIANPRG